MEPRPFSSDLHSHLREHERMLSRKYGVRLRVDRITSNGKNAFCSIAHVRCPWFRSTRSAEELIDLAHTALMPLHQVGLSPLISILPRQPGTTFPAIDTSDPFGIHGALRLLVSHEPPSSATAQKQGTLR